MAASLTKFANKNAKLVLFPDEFKPVKTIVKGVEYTYVPSITVLGSKKMNIMVEGSVAHLRDERIYGDKFNWVTLPDKELKKK